jgi:hypothetical protein
VLCGAVGRVERVLVGEKVYGSVPQEVPLLRTGLRILSEPLLSAGI